MTSILSVFVFSGTIIYAVGSSSKKIVTNNFTPAEIINGVVEDETGTGTSVITGKDYTFTNENGTLSVDKQVEILNVDAENSSNADAFVRVTIIPMWITDDNNINFVVGAMDDIINDEVNESVLETQIVEVTNQDTTSIIYVQTTYESDNNNDYLDISSFGDLKEININDNKFTIGDITFTLADNWSEKWFFNSNDGYFYYRYVLEPNEKTTPLLKSVSIDDSKLYRYDNNPITLRVDILSDSVQAMGEAVNELWTNVEKSFVTETVTSTDEDGSTFTSTYMDDENYKYGYILKEVTTTTTSSDS